MDAPPLVLVAGASGFVGRHLCPALSAAGVGVKCGSRVPARASRTAPDAAWVTLDASDQPSIAAALCGCDSAVYLVHRLGEGPDFAAEEALAARNFARAARSAALRRLVYVGGVAPRGRVSAHLKSRLETGRILREQFENTIELRASMIIGHGSESFAMVRTLAARAPLALAPPWLGYRSCPVAIDDVVAAVLFALRAHGLRPDWYDVPGPECMSHRNVLARIADLLGTNLRWLEVPSLKPKWAARAMGAFVRDESGRIAQLIEGLDSDLAPERGHSLWQQLPQHQPRSFDAAVHDALLDQGEEVSPSQRTRQRLSRLAAELNAALASRGGLAS